MKPGMTTPLPNQQAAVDHQSMDPPAVQRKKAPTALERAAADHMARCLAAEWALISKEPKSEEEKNMQSSE